MAKHWIVTWEIDDEHAETPQAAAMSALGHIIRPGSIAHVFTVSDVANGETVTVDLDQLAPVSEERPTR